MVGGSGWSKTWTYYEDDWQEGNVPIMGSRTHASWAGSSVFDGARAFEGLTPDLSLHCERVNHSAARMLLKPVVAVETWLGLVAEGLTRFDDQAELYIRPMYWAVRNGPSTVAQDPDSICWCLTIYEAPMPKPNGISITHSPFRCPTNETMPVEAKAGCLYPNNARALIEARGRGFDDCLVSDMLGNVAELSNANVFMAKYGVVLTPVPNGTFLNGITRRRVIHLLRHAGIEVVEKSLRYRDFELADEIFATGNHAKVIPVTRIGDRALQPGRFFSKARALYWEFAHSSWSGHSARRIAAAM
jgi:branched-chain amino acid aminotransferase